MRWATASQQVRNRGKFKNNNSGVTGVAFRVDRGRTYAYAVWTELDGKVKSKCFSCRKLGLIPAFAAACTHRMNMIDILNKNGAGYTAECDK